LLPLFSADVRAVEESDSKIVEGGIAAVGWRWALGIGGTEGRAEGGLMSDVLVVVELVVDIVLPVPTGGWTVDLRSSRCCATFVRPVVIVIVIILPIDQIGSEDREPKRANKDQR
jgi:hypothetical protein